jgi:hypothetical protein
MTDELIVQFLRFEAQKLERVYFFSVRRGSAERHDTSVTILNEAFDSHRARYQDAAAICSARLHRELEGDAERMLETHYAITDAELEDFRSAHSQKPFRSLHPRKTPGAQI